jgi:hypothetical protein
MTTITTRAQTSILNLGRLVPVQAGAALIAFAVMLFAPQVLNDPDTYWHLAAGEWMIAHGRVLHRDVFSFTHAGQPWQTHEWLSEVIMGLAFRAGAWSGLLILYAASVAAAAALLANRLSRSLNGLTLLVVLVLAFACVAPSLLLRPHVLVLPIVVAWTAELLAARDEGRAPHWFMAGLMALWANLHGSYVFGFLLFAPLALEALLAPTAGRLQVLRAWAPVGMLCAAAALATPHGLAGVIHPFQLMGMSTLNAIVEWRPADFAQVTGFEISLLAMLFVCLSRGVRIPPLRLVLLLFMLHMSLQHQRHQIVLAIAAPLILAQPLAEALGQTAHARVRGGANWAILIVVAVLLAGARIAFPVTRSDGPITPAAALAHVPADLAARPVLNSYGFGGYLIFRGVRPFIDGRADMYGDDHMRLHQRLMSGDAASFDAAARRYGLAWVLLSPDERLASAMNAKPGWRRLYGDRNAVVFVRDATDRGPGGVQTRAQDASSGPRPLALQ